MIHPNVFHEIYIWIYPPNQDYLNFSRESLQTCLIETGIMGGGLDSRDVNQLMFAIFFREKFGPIFSLLGWMGSWHLNIFPKKIWPNYNISPT